MSFDIIQVLILLGFINSLMFLFLLTKAPKKYRRASRLLAVFIFLFSLNLTSWSVLYKLTANYDWFCMGRNPVLFFLGPVFYAFTHEVFGTKDKNIINLKTLIPGFLDIAFTLGLWIYIYFFALSDKFLLLYDTLQLNIYQGLAIVHNGIYLLLSLRTFFRGKSHARRGIFLWIFLIICVIFVSWTLYYLVELYVYPSTLSNEYYYPLWIIILVLNLYLGFNILLHPSRLNVSKTSVEELPSDTKVLSGRLNSLMEKEKLYRKQDLTLSYVAGQLDTTNRRLSQSIKNNLGTSFYEYINERRVHDVIASFENKEDQHYTIETIAEKAGFRSKTTFLKAFKGKTGMLPKEFLNRMDR